MTYVFAICCIEITNFYYIANFALNETFIAITCISGQCSHFIPHKSSRQPNNQKNKSFLVFSGDMIQEHWPDTG